MSITSRFMPFRGLSAAIAFASTTLHAGNWIESQDHGGRIWFLHNSTPRIESFDRATRSWSPAIPLPRIPAAFEVTDSCIYVVSQKSLYRYRLDGSGESLLQTFAMAPAGVFADRGLVFVSGNGTFISLRSADGTALDTATAYYSKLSRGVSHSADGNVFHGVSSGISPADVGVLVYDDQGIFAGEHESPYHGDYPVGSRTWTTPDGSRVIDNQGIAYASPKLEYLGSLACKPSDLQFLGGTLPVAIAGDTLRAFDRSLLETGFFVLGQVPASIFLTDSSVLLFFREDTMPNGMRVDSVRISALKPADPGSRLDPPDFAVVPDDAFLAGDDLLLLSSANRSLYRWDIARSAWKASIPLLGNPAYATWADSLRKAFTCYGNGKILAIDLDSAQPSEAPFATLAEGCLGLVGAGRHLVASDASGAWESHSVFDGTGKRVSYRDWNHPLHQAAWSQPARKVFHFRDGTSPNDLHSEEIGADGAIGAQEESPYHGDHPIVYPIRVAPDGSIVVLGSGHVYDAQTLEMIDTLPRTLSDAAWIGSDIYALGSGRIVQLRAPTYRSSDSVTIPGKPLRLWSIENQRLLVLRLDSAGIPRIDQYSATLQKIDPIPVSTRAPHPRAAGGGIHQVVLTDLQGRILWRGATDDPRSWSYLGPRRLSSGVYQAIFTDAAGAVSRRAVRIGFDR